MDEQFSNYLIQVAGGSDSVIEKAMKTFLYQNQEILQWIVWSVFLIGLILLFAHNPKETDAKCDCMYGCDNECIKNKGCVCHRKYA